MDHLRRQRRKRARVGCSFPQRLPVARKKNVNTSPRDRRDMKCRVLKVLSLRHCEPESAAGSTQMGNVGSAISPIVTKRMHVMKLQRANCLALILSSLSPAFQKLHSANPKTGFLETLSQHVGGSSLSELIPTVILNAMQPIVFHVTGSHANLHSS